MGSSQQDAVEKVRMPNHAKLSAPRKAYHRIRTVAQNCNFDKKVAKALNSRMAGSANQAASGTQDEEPHWQPTDYGNTGEHSSRRYAIPAQRASNSNSLGQRPRNRASLAMVEAQRAGDSVGTCRMSNSWAVGPLVRMCAPCSWPDGPGYLNGWPVGPKRIECGPLGRDGLDRGPLGRNPLNAARWAGARNADANAGRWFAIPAQGASNSNSLGQRPRNLTSPR